jgi:hypothetical protein
MRGNSTGGIILLLLGAVIISMGVSEKGKQIFNILTNGQGSILGGGNSLDDTPSEKFGGHPADPDYKPPFEGTLGMVGEKGAVAVG